MTTEALLPCQRCLRHVRVAASRCPFCEATLSAPSAAAGATAELPRGSSRAAIVAFGATLALAGCRSAGRANTDEQPLIMQPYGAPPTPPRDVPVVALATGDVPSAHEAILWSLWASSTTLRMDERASFRLTITATNQGSAVVNPWLTQWSFRVNGESSMVANNAFGNGGHANAFYAVPPGGTESDARDLGESLFPTPGTYEIAYEHHGRVVATLSVRVTAARVDPAATRRRE